MRFSRPYFLLSVIFVCLFAVNCFAQDSLNTNVTFKKKVTDSIAISKVKKPHSGKTAAIKSLILIGWGQIYNRRYWKLPIVYGGFGGLGYAIYFNTKNYRQYKTAIRLRNDDNPDTIDEFDGLYSSAQLSTLKNFYRRNLDLSIIGTVVLYALNIVDAAVDGHLREFDVTDDLSLKFRPKLNTLGETQIAPTPQLDLTSITPGVSISLMFK